LNLRPLGYERSEVLAQPSYVECPDGKNFGCVPVLKVCR
jgi:hypothetical protein